MLLHLYLFRTGNMLSLHGCWRMSVTGCGRPPSVAVWQRESTSLLFHYGRCDAEPSYKRSLLHFVLSQWMRGRWWRTSVHCGCCLEKYLRCRRAQEVARPAGGIAITAFTIYWKMKA